MNDLIKHGNALARLLVASVLFVGTSSAAEEAGTQSAENGCERWSMKGLAPGMTLGRFKETHSNAKHGRNWFRPDDRGRDWYFSAESRMHGVYNYVLPESDADTSPIISVVAMIDMTDTSPSAVVGALSERWGPPREREIPVAKVRYFNAFGAPRGEVEWKATVWQDAACDVLVTALERPAIAYLLGTKTEMFMVSIDSISKLVIASEERRKKALDATRP